jgi:phosphatidylserine/phosphatidylglycerophosphate/cardiolipin synthase-like enzyme
VKLIIQPDDGMAPVIAAIRSARSSIDTTVFRFDRPEVEKALATAVSHGVRVRALVAHTNRGGEKRLRKLEQSLLAAGVTTARTGDDLVRYHGKILIVDGKTLHVMLFNYTGLDLKSRSFAIATRQRSFVTEAMRLFEADTTRQPYETSAPGLVVSPENARKQLADFLGKAKKELCIYDPKVSDGPMIRLLGERVRKGVDVRIIGALGARATPLRAVKLKSLRLHARCIIRDGRHAFLGSQSLRALELDSRREVGIFVRDPAIVKRLRDVFESDWATTAAAADGDGLKQKGRDKGEEREALSA